MSENPPKAKLICSKGPEKGLEILLQDSPVQVGRDPKKNTLTLQDASVSREHARFFPQDGTWFAEDLKSSNGVFVNDQRLSEPTPFHDGDLLRVGHVPFTAFIEGEKKPEPEAEVGATMVGVAAAVDAPDKTLMFGDNQATMFGGNKAISAFVASMKEARPEPVTAPEDGGEKGKAREEPVAVEGYVKEAQSLFWVKLKLGAALLVFLAVVGGGGFYLIGKSKQAKAKAKAVRSARQDVDNFVNTNEKRLLKENELAEIVDGELSILRAVRESVARKLKEFQAGEELQATLAKADFLILERELLRNENNYAVCEKLLDAAQTADFAKTEIGSELLPFAKLVMQFHDFGRKFPAPPTVAEEAAPKGKVAELIALSAELKQGYQKNKRHMSVWCNQFDRIAQEAIDREEPLVVMWSRFWKDVEDYETAPAAEKVKIHETLVKAYPRIKFLQKSN
jgi:pSer/pThr/pTyr-binding forkhead associated (FHA) protein